MQAGAEAMRPHDFESWGLFLWSSAVSSDQEDEMAEIEKELRHYLEGAVEPRAALEWSRETRAAMVDLKFCDLLGTWQHVTLPIGSFDESAFDEGLGFDGSSIRGWQGIEESDMILMPDASTATPRSVHRGADALAPLRDRGARDARAVREGSAPRREAGRGVPALDRHRRHVLRRARVRVLRLRRGLVHEHARTRRATRSTRPRATGTPATPASGTRSARSRATSRRRRTTRCTICARAWC